MNIGCMLSNRHELRDGGTERNNGCISSGCLRHVSG